MQGLSDTLKGIYWMVMAMAGFAVCDMLIKMLSGGLAVGYILLFLGLAGLPIFLAMGLRAGQKIWTYQLFHPGLVNRNLAEAVGTVCVVTSLSLSDLSLVSGILQSTPLFVTIGAALMLKERVGPRRWAAVVIGLVGVLLILQPGQGEVSYGLFLALIGTMGLAARDVFTRRVPAEIPTLVVATTGFFMGIPVGLILIALDPHVPVLTPNLVLLLGVCVVILVLSYYAITAAMRMGEASLVTPFRYSRILFALALGFVIFGERPNALALLGVVVVVGSGLFILIIGRLRGARV